MVTVVCYSKLEVVFVGFVTFCEVEAYCIREI